VGPAGLNDLASLFDRRTICCVVRRAEARVAMRYLLRRRMQSGFRSNHRGPLSLGADDLLRLATFMIGAVLVSSLTMARRQAEEATLDAEKQLNITLKSIGDAVITTDAAGGLRL